jgi:hypothetical protein
LHAGRKDEGRSPQTIIGPAVPPPIGAAVLLVASSHSALKKLLV